jgi:hypothetical protein
MQAPDQEKLIRRFLLGELASHEREPVEERLLTDKAFLSQVEAAEDDLVDDYVHGKLSSLEIEKFEKYFLSVHERREHVHFSRALQSVLTEDREISQPSATKTFVAPRRGFWSGLFTRPVLAAALTVSVLLLAVALVWFGVMRRSGEESASKQSNGSETGGNRSTTPNGPNENNVRAEATPKQGATNAKESGKNNVASNGAPNRNQKRGTGETSYFAAVLTPGALRSEGSGIKQFSVPPRARTVRLKLILDAATSHSLEGEVLTADGDTLMKLGNLKTSGATRGNPFTTIDIPTSRLSDGDYQIVVRSTGDDISVARYYFRVRGLTQSNPE